MLTVQPSRCTVGNEKLRTVRSRTRIRHRKCSRAVVRKIRVNLVFKFVSRTASTCSSWVSTLDHEIRDNSVESEAVVIRSTAVLCRVLECSFC